MIAKYVITWIWRESPLPDSNHEKQRRKNSGNVKKEDGKSLKMVIKRGLQSNLVLQVAIGANRANCQFINPYKHKYRHTDGQKVNHKGRSSHRKCMQINRHTGCSLTIVFFLRF